MFKFVKKYFPLVVDLFLHLSLKYKIFFQLIDVLLGFIQILRFNLNKAFFRNK